MNEVKNGHKDPKQIPKYLLQGQATNADLLHGCQIAI